MTASMGLLNLAMGGIIVGGILLLAVLIVWAILRADNKIGPLAAAQQEKEIEEMKVRSVLAAKNAEVEMANADARIIEARSKAALAKSKAEEAEFQMIERRLQLSSGHTNGASPEVPIPSDT